MELGLVGTGDGTSVGSLLWHLVLELAVPREGETGVRYVCRGKSRLKATHELKPTPVLVTIPSVLSTCSGTSSFSWMCAHTLLRRGQPGRWTPGRWVFAGLVVASHQTLESTDEQEGMWLPRAAFCQTAVPAHCPAWRHQAGECRDMQLSLVKWAQFKAITKYIPLAC